MLEAPRCQSERGYTRGDGHACVCIESSGHPPFYNRYHQCRCGSLWKDNTTPNDQEIPMADTPALTVADLTDEHIGWEIRVGLTPKADDLFPKYHQDIQLGAIRRWEYPEGTPRAGLLDRSTKTGRIAGTEHHLPVDAPVTLLQQFRKPRKKRS